MLLFKKLGKYVVLTWLSRTIWQSNGSGFSEPEIAVCNTEQRKSTPRGSSRHSRWPTQGSGLPSKTTQFLCEQPSSSSTLVECFCCTSEFVKPHWLWWSTWVEIDNDCLVVMNLKKEHLGKDLSQVAIWDSKSQDSLEHSCKWWSV